MIPIIFGAPLHLWLGIILFLCIVFQILVAKKVIRINFKWHRVTGYVILVLAVIHGLIGIGLYFGFLQYAL
jgi:hypothetical protein